MDSITSFLDTNLGTTFGTAATDAGSAAADAGSAAIDAGTVADAAAGAAGAVGDLGNAAGGAAGSAAGGAAGGAAGAVGDAVASAADPAGAGLAGATLPAAAPAVTGGTGAVLSAAGEAASSSPIGGAIDPSVLQQIPGAASTSSSSALDPIAASNLAADTASANPYQAGQVANTVSKFAGSDSGGFGSGVLDFIKKNPGLLAAGAGLGVTALNQPNLPSPSGPSGTVTQQNTLGGNVNAVATADLAAGASGVLPPGAEAMVKQGLDKTILDIKSKYASLGMAGSTSEQAEIDQANERAQAARFDMAQKLTTQGLQAAGLADSIYSQIAGYSLGQDKSLSDALSRLAGAAGTSSGTQPKAA
jgi:hypothetical protein